MRLIAGVVLLLTCVTLGLQQWWLLVPLAGDFVLRAVVGPKASPVAQVVTRIVRPRVHARPRPVPGPPKRFAAAIGAVMTTTAVLLLLAHSASGVPGLMTGVVVITVLMVAFPALEAVFGLCVGCVLFSLLMRAGIIPEAVCRECSDISTRSRASQRA